MIAMFADLEIVHFFTGLLGEEQIEPAHEFFTKYLSPKLIKLFHQKMFIFRIMPTLQERVLEYAVKSRELAVEQLRAREALYTPYERELRSWSSIGERAVCDGWRFKTCNENYFQMSHPEIGQVTYLFDEERWLFEKHVRKSRLLELFPDVMKVAFNFARQGITVIMPEMPHDRHMTLEN